MGDQQQQQQEVLNKFQKNIESIKNKVGSFNTDKPKIMAVLKQIVQKLSRIKLNNDGMKQVIQKKDAEINRLKKDIIAASNYINNIDQQIREQETKIKVYEEEKKECEAEKTKMQNKIIALNQELSNLKGQLKTASKQFNDKINNLNNTIANKETELDSLSQNYNKLNEEYQTLKLKILSLNQEKQEFEKKALAAETNLTQYVTNVNNLVSQLDEAVKHMENDIQTNDIITEINKINELIQENGDNNNDNNNMGLNNSPVEESKGEVPPQQQSAPPGNPGAPPNANPQITNNKVINIIQKIKTGPKPVPLPNNNTLNQHIENIKANFETAKQNLLTKKIANPLKSAIENYDNLRNDQNLAILLNIILNTTDDVKKEFGINTKTTETTGGRRTRRRKGRRRTQRGGYRYPESEKLNKASTIVSGSNKKRGKTKINKSKPKFNTRRRK
jgi:chromosome segregation ATPase